MILKIISGVLILFASFMGIRHGIAVWNIKPGDIGPIAELYKKINFLPFAIKAVAVCTILAAIMILFPQTFLWGNLLNAAIIIVLMGMLLNVRELKHALAELPILIITLIIIYLKHPFAQGK